MLIVVTCVASQKLLSFRMVVAGEVVRGVACHGQRCCSGCSAFRCWSVRSAPGRGGYWRRSTTRRRSRGCWGRWGCLDRRLGRLGAGRRRVAKAGDRTATPAGRSDGKARCGGSLGAAAGDRYGRWAEIGAVGTDFRQAWVVRDCSLNFLRAWFAPRTRPQRGSGNTDDTAGTRRARHGWGNPPGRGRWVHTLIAACGRNQRLCRRGRR
jgi:hypothetical protein